MNLITGGWLPVTRQNGQADIIAPWQIAETDNPVLEINAPRPDFQGALYQFLIGLLQTCFAPEDEDQWQAYWEDTPEPEVLKASFAKVAFAFELDAKDAPAFLQDFALPDGETKAIAALLIEAPGGKTLKDNLDHFVKRDQVNQLCLSCTATALFTLQTNAPSGGVGHRVGLRGGGPLTTLIFPKAPSASLWHKLWLNVLNQEDLEAAEKIDARVLPWLGKTRVSEKGQTTSPGDVHPLHA
jgi:CRISPR system Cascade subunit CasA